MNLVRFFRGALTFAVITFILAVLLRNSRFDDPYITYRFAENFAAGRGFIFDEGTRALITTAPLYALLLGVFRMFGADVPTTSFIIGVTSIFIGTLILYRIQESYGVTASVVYVAFPLLWLTVGFETPLFLAVALGAFLFFGKGHRAWASALCGIAFGLRGDGGVVWITLLLVEFFQTFPSLVQKTKTFSIAKNFLALTLPALLIYAPLAMWLVSQFGSPLPTTLLTKSAQAQSGLTGFYTSTTFAEGAWLLVQSYLRHSIMFVVILLFFVIGSTIFSIELLREIFSKNRRSPHPRAEVGILSGQYPSLQFAIPLWALLHFIAYNLIGVAPYVWYYAPLIPGIACVIGLGVNVIGAKLSAATHKAISIHGVTALLLVALITLIYPTYVVLAGGTPPPPDDIRSKVLPETKVDIYERVGKWINTNTPKDATLGVTELGVMGYYANRRTVDFLGLTQPEHIDHIRRGDFFAALFREQPDYLALTSINAIYDFDPQKDKWFKLIYSPIQTFDEIRFWGSPITIWKRTRAPIRADTPIIWRESQSDLGEGWNVRNVFASARVIIPGEPLLLRIELGVGARIGNKTLRVQPVLIAGGDGLPVVSRLIHTDRWRESGFIDFMFVPQAKPPRGGYWVNIRWLENPSGVEVGYLKVPLGESADFTNFIELSRGVGVAKLDAPISACAGKAFEVPLVWRGGEPLDSNYTAYIHIRKPNDIALIAQADAPPLFGTYPTSVWSKDEIIHDPRALMLTILAENELTFDVVVGLYRPTDNTRLEVNPSPERTTDGGVKIGEVVVKKCE
jgi:hypothetical protein